MKTAVILFMTAWLCLSYSSKEECAKALHDLENRQIELSQVNAHLVTLKRNLINSMLELEVSKDRLQRVKQFQLLRTSSERESQIKKATQNVLNMLKVIEDISGRIETLNDSVMYSEREIVRLKEILRVISLFHP